MLLSSKDIKKKDMIVDLDKQTITIEALDLVIDIQLINDAAERVKQAKGIQNARSKGKHIGRPFKDIDKFEYYLNQVKEGSITAKEAADKLGISKATFYRRSNNIRQGLQK